MRQLRLLVLGHKDIPDGLRVRLMRHDLEIKVTSLRREEIYYEGAEGYVISPRGIELVRVATPGDYDAIVICNNLGTGLTYAGEVPLNMRVLTMIAWNNLQPGDEVPYVGMGFVHFGNWHRGAEGVPWIEDFLLEIASQMPAS